MESLTREEVKRYCIVNNLFTCGCNNQYEKMLNLVDMQYPLHDIATIIWCCSDTDKHADEIENDLRQIALEYERISEEHRREGSE